MKNPGEGSVTELRNGRFWVRSPEHDGERKGLGTYATREEADAVLGVARARLATPNAVTGLTFEKFGGDVLDQREGDGFRGVDKDRDRFDFHLTKCPLAGMLVTDIRPANGAELARWLGKRWAADKRGKRRIKRTTVLAIFNVASVIMNEAVFRELIPANPLAGIEIRKRADEDTEDVWTYWSLAEQRAFVACEAIPYIDRLIVRFAMGCGIREGELHHNFLKDLHVGPDEKRPRLFVRFGSKGKAPKNGKPRTVDIFGDALVAIREWLEIRKTYMRKSARHEVQKDIGLIFPTVTGCRRQESKTFGNGWKDKETGEWVDRFKHYCRLAGIQERPGLYFHCLRHTCATSMLQGLWGGKGAALEVVQEQLGHSSISVTQRYAHKTGDRVARYAAEMNAGYALVTTGGPTPSSVAAISNDSEESRESGLNRRPALYESPGQVSRSLALVVKDPLESGPRNQVSTVAALAATYLDLVRKGQREAALAVGVSLASAALAAEPLEVESRTA